MLEVTEEEIAVSASLQVDGSKISFEDYLIKYDGQHAEWVDGKVEIRMPVAYKHQAIISFLISILRPWTEVNDAGVICAAPLAMKINQDRKGREPDILFVAKENLHRLKPTFVDGAADLVIEIVSPESQTRDRGDKFYEYEAGGVQEYWLIDPERQQAEFYLLNENNIFQFAAVDQDGKFRSRVLTDLELPIEWLWRDDLPTTIEVLREWKLI